MICNEAWMKHSGIQGELTFPDSFSLHPGYVVVRQVIAGVAKQYTVQVNKKIIN